MRYRKLTAAAMAAALALSSSGYAPMSIAADTGTATAAAEPEKKGVKFDGRTFFFVTEDGKDYIECDGMRFMESVRGAVLVSGAEAQGDIDIPGRILLPTPPGIFTNEAVTDMVTEIEDGAFRDNRAITSVKIPESVQRIGCDAFSGCEFLLNADIPANITDIGGGAFEKTGYADRHTGYDSALVINGTAVSPRHGAICILPEGTKRIADRFADNSSMEFIRIPEGVTKIGESAFEGCQYLSNIYLPKSLETVGENAFYHCYHRHIYYAGTQAEFGAVSLDDGNDVFTNGAPLEYGREFPLTRTENGVKVNSYGYKAGVVSCEIPASGEVDIPVSVRVPEEQTLCVTRIESGAFSDCKGIVCVKIPAMVNYIAEDAFEGCTDLKDIYFDGTEDRWEKLMSRPELPEGVTVHCEGAPRTDTEVYGFDGRVNDGLDAYGQVYIGNEYSSIDASAFEGNRDITSVTLSQEMRNVGDRAFAGCASLGEVRITGTHVRFGKDVFENCIYLSDVWFSGSRHDWEVIEGSAGLPEGVKVHCSDDAPDEPAFRVVDGILTDGMYASGDVVIPDGVKIINDDAFRDNRNITSVTIPDSVEKIRVGAFSGCTALSTVNAPDTFIDVDPWAFGYSEKEEALWYREQLAENETFVFCGNLMQMPDTEEYTVPGGVKQISCKGTGLEKLKKLTIPEGVMFIQHSFNHCNRLVTLELPASLAMLDNSFGECGSLERAGYAGTDEDWKKLSIENSLNYGKVKVWNGGDEPLPLTVTEPVTEPLPTEYDYSGLPYVELNEESEQKIAAGSTVEIRIFGEGFTPVIRKPEGGSWVADDSGDVLEFSFKEQKETVRGIMTIYKVTAKKPGVRQLFFDMKTPDERYSPCISFTVTDGEKTAAKGDANCDGKLTVADAVAVLQFIANKTKYPLSDEGMLNADIDGEKGITGGDAAAIQRLDAGISGAPEN
jgi:hypothetical protein